MTSMTVTSSVRDDQIRTGRPLSDSMGSDDRAQSEVLLVLAERRERAKAVLTTLGARHNGLTEAATGILKLDGIGKCDLGWLLTESFARGKAP